MPRPPSPDLLALEVAKLRSAGPTDDTRAALRKYLSHKSNLVVAKAAEVAADLKLPDLSPDLESAFARFFTADDKGCLARTAIVAALNHLSAGSADTFLRGLHHVQLEASFGPPTDTAGPLRATCALALSSLGAPSLLPEIADLLADPLPPCRSAAARALAHTRDDAAIPPLRLKLLTGDPEPEVLEECLTSLVTLSPKNAVLFLSRLLDRTDRKPNHPTAPAHAPARPAILLALGTTRDDAALTLLLTRYDRDITPASRKELLPAIALTRLPRAIDFLLDQFSTAHPSLAESALDALALYKHDKNVISRAGKVLAERDESELQSRFNERFGTTPPQ